MRPYRALIIAITWRTLVAGLCVLGIWHSWAFARADFLFQLNTAESLRKAIQIEPDAWKYYMRLALLDDEHAPQLLETALKANPYDAQADIELGLRLEAAGDYSRAEKLLLDAFAIDHTFLPRWSLANFYLRRENLPAFWAWARRAAEMPSDSAGPLLELCWRVSPDPNEITDRILNDDPTLLRQYLDFLFAKDQVAAAGTIAQRLIQVGDSTTDDSRLFSAIDHLIAANEGHAAKALWDTLIGKHWIVADATFPNNANFERDPLPVRFDWALPSYPGLHSWPGPSGLEIEFSGSEPEDCTIAEQVLVLPPGNYHMGFSYQTNGIPPETGVRWQILEPGAENPLAGSSDLSSEDVNHQEMSFSVPPEASMTRIRLGYRRALGTTRITGTLLVSSIRILPDPR